MIVEQPSASSTLANQQLNVPAPSLPMVHRGMPFRPHLASRFSLRSHPLSSIRLLLGDTQRQPCVEPITLEDLSRRNPFRTTTPLPQPRSTSFTTLSTTANDTDQVQDGPVLSRNTRAQARHRAKRKAYIEQVSSSYVLLHLQ